MLQSIAVVGSWRKDDPHRVSLRLLFCDNSYSAECTSATKALCGNVAVAPAACKRLPVEVQGLAPGASQAVPRHAAVCAGGNMASDLRQVAMLLQAEKIRKAFGVASQPAAHEASSAAPAPPAASSSNQQEAMSDLLQRVFEL